MVFSALASMFCTIKYEKILHTIVNKIASQIHSLKRNLHFAIYFHYMHMSTVTSPSTHRNHNTTREHVEMSPAWTRVSDTLWSPGNDIIARRPFVATCEQQQRGPNGNVISANGRYLTCSRRVSATCAGCFGGGGGVCVSVCFCFTCSVQFVTSTPASVEGQVWCRNPAPTSFLPLHVY